MDYLPYISEVINYRQIKLNDKERIFLEKIQEYPRSAYQLTSEVTRHYYDTHYPKLGKAYKNIRKGIQSLVASKLITQLDSRKLYEQGKIELNIHAAKYYGLTSFGLFNVLFRAMASIDCLMEYEKNIILQTLLYPFFERHTIESMTNRLDSALFLYLAACCQLTLYSVNEIRSAKGKENKQGKIREFESDLESKAKVFAFELVTKNDFLSRRGIKDTENQSIAFLLGDKKFMNLLKTIKGDWKTSIFNV